MSQFLTNVLAHIVFGVGVIRQYTGARTRDRRHYQAAERHYSAVLVLRPDYVHAKRARGMLRWRELNNPEGAIADFQDLRTTDLDYHDGLFYEGMAWVQLGEYQDAAALFAEFIRVAPTSRWKHSATLQLQSLSAILDDMPKLISPPSDIVSGEIAED